MNKFVQVSSWCVLMMFIIVCIYYTLLNATWLIGDDAIVISHVGIGKPFLPSDTVSSASGRFFPLAYLMYNILILFCDGWVSAQIIYMFQAVFYVAGIIMFMFSFYKILDKENWNCIIAVCCAIFIGARVYSGVINCYSTIWFDMFAQSFVMLFYILFCQTKKYIYGLVSLLMIIWCTYCTEIGFVVPLVLGVCGLVLRSGVADKKEKTYYLISIINALIFLLVYYFCIWTKTNDVYDPSHGSEISYCGNIIYILRSQKFLWVALLVLLVRIWDVLCHKDKVSIYDILLLAAAGHCCACFILKLNWVLYYHKAIFFSLPAVIYYCNHYFNSKVTVILMLVFAVFYCSKMPRIINENQQDRINTDKYISCVVDKINCGYNLFWYAPNVGDPNSYENTLRDWIKDSFQTLVGWNLHNMEYRMISISDFKYEYGYYLLPIYNEKLQVGTNSLIERIGICVAEDNTRGLKLYKID